MRELASVYSVIETDREAAAQWYRKQGHSEVDPRFTKRCRAFAVVDGSITIGMALVIERQTNPYSNTLTNTLSSVLIDPDRRGRGYALALVGYIVRLYAELTLTVLETNDHAVRLYRSLGFRLIRASEDGRLVMRADTPGFDRPESATTQPDLFASPEPAPGRGLVKLHLIERDWITGKGIAEGLGIRGALKPEKMHVTCMYDRANGLPADAEGRRQFEATVTGVIEIGSGTHRSVAVSIDSPSIVEFHLMLERLGGNHSHPEFTPHMSLKYQPSTMDLQNARIRQRVQIGKVLRFQEVPWITLDDRKR